MGTRGFISAVRKTIRAMNEALGNILTLLTVFFSSKVVQGPLVSVIIATYNKPETLTLAIKSVLDQTYRNFEIVVVGDACTDNTEDVVKAIADKRISWFSLSENSGSQSLPNNLGLSHATGKYVAYLGHDDSWLPNHLATVVGSMEKHSLDIATTRCVLIGPPGSRAIMLTGPGVWGTRRVTPPPSSLCHRRDLVEKSGDWADYKNLALNLPPDQEFIMRISATMAKRRALRQATVLKLPAAWRTNFYQSGDATEHQHWTDSVSKAPRKTMIFLVAKASLYRLFGVTPRLPTNSMVREDGEHLVDTWRRIKGLPER